MLSCTNFSNKQNTGQVFIPDTRIEEIKTRLSNQSEPTSSAFKVLEAFVNENKNRVPSVPQQWFVPYFYDDPEGHTRAKESLQNDANAAYGFALYYRLTNDDFYAQKAVELINAWSTQIQSFRDVEDSMLSFSYHFPALIFAADLLRDEKIWALDDQQQFKSFIRKDAYAMNTMSHENNWGNWGLVLASSIASFLQDDSLLTICGDRWKYFIENQIAEDGTLPHEVTRNGGRSGVWYSHFCLMPQTIAAEILKQSGIDLYEYEYPSGRTLEKAYHKIAYWTTHPDDFQYWDGPLEQLGGTSYYSYFEILNSLWPDDNASQGLEKTRPQTANHSAPFLTLTHGGY